MSFFDLDKNESSEDILLERNIKELLQNSKKINAKDITVLVQDRGVSLSGTVRTQFERDYVEKMIKQISGIEKIHSDIIVKRNPGILPTDIGRNP